MSTKILKAKTPQIPTEPLILASSSPYRLSLLQNQWPGPVVAIPPQVDEDSIKKQFFLKHPYPWSLKMAEKLALELAQAKASSLIHSPLPSRWVLGCDQLVWAHGQIWGKPGNRERALETLKAFQKGFHWLITAQVLWDAQNQLPPALAVVKARIRLRPLSIAEIEAYLDWDQPWDCAGSYKWEKRGWWLMQDIQCVDWSAIQGLSLLALRRQWLQMQKRKRPHI